MELFVQAGRLPARPVHVSLQSINQSGVHVHADKTRELSKWTGITSIDKKKIYLHIDPTVSVAPAGGGKRFVHIVGQLAPTSTDRCALAGAGQAISGRDGAGASAGSASSARGCSCDDGGVGVGVRVGIQRDGGGGREAERAPGAALARRHRVAQDRRPVLRRIQQLHPGMVTPSCAAMLRPSIFLGSHHVEVVGGRARA